jgi:hypothetical protein
MGSSNGQWGRDVTPCPECDAKGGADTIRTDDPLQCRECGCRFHLGPVPFGAGMGGPQVIEHGDRWRRFRLVPHAQVRWDVGGLGVGWERKSQGLELYLGLGPVTLSLYGGPGLAR